MVDDWELSEGDAAGLSPGWKTLGLVVAFYTACAVWATYPIVKTLSSALPSPPLDPLQHLWIMRWYKSCLLQGRLPFLCPELQYPVGAPLGNFSPMHFESLLYLPLSLLSKNDILCYNLIWLFGFVFTGLGTYLLAWYVLRDRAAAAFSGLLAMLATPVMAHSFGHVELIYLGWFPLFLVAWLRFVDQPSWKRLLAAGLTYLLVAMSAAYFTVFAIFPAALYAAWQATKAVRQGDRAWL
ncbi:MAG TPA: hypothetical protein VGZ22_25335, partial [Isosphaeraceae bacterium]|nr:hypothetical protein [Isosphaeraceae bacterium]